MSEHDPSLAERLVQFLHRFRDAFRRREQLRWAAVYMQGLLQKDGRKTIENLARAVPRPPRQGVEDVAQALQHFINQSPWDEEKLWRAYQRWLASEIDATDGLFVLEEFAFPKQGRHSVGVQRQYTAALDRKTNCQVAIGLSHISSAVCSPLRLRLYLPRHWLEAPARLAETGVPAGAQRPLSKTAIALELLDEALAAGISVRQVALGNAWGNSEELARAIDERGLQWRNVLPLETGQAVRELRATLLEVRGLNHFEGRSWRGFHHHACLVMLAEAFVLFQPRNRAVSSIG